MIEPKSLKKRTILEYSPILQLRRNHGLEHATLHILAEKNFNQRFAGYSDLKGFWIVGEVHTEELVHAIEEALSRLQSGDHLLAVHPNCGTNFATAGILAGGVASLTMLGSEKGLKDKLERIPFAMTLATLAIIIAQPLGLLIQEKITTTGNMGTLRVESIRKIDQGAFSAHRILTRTA